MMSGVHSPLVAILLMYLIDSFLQLPEELKWTSDAKFSTRINRKLEEKQTTEE